MSIPFLASFALAAEVRSLDELELGAEVTQPQLAKGELQMAKRLVEDMSADWEPEQYRDSFEDKIHALVEKKARAGKIEDVETQAGEEQRKSADIIDLTEMLKRSLGSRPSAKAPAKSAKPATRRAPAKPASKKAPSKKSTHKTRA